MCLGCMDANSDWCLFVSVCICGQFPGPLGWAAQGTEREWPASLPPTWLPQSHDLHRTSRDISSGRLLCPSLPLPPTPPSNAFRKRPTCRGRGETWLTPRGQRPWPRAGEALASLLTLDEGGSLERSSASPMVSLDFPYCVGENPFLWQERLPSTL